MFEVEPLHDIEVIHGYPGELNRLVINGQLDMSPVSAAVYPEIQESYSILSNYCLSSIGYVKSVVLLSKVPIEELDGLKVGLSGASLTSRVLLKVLLQKHYRINAEYVETSPLPDLINLDAALVIGNEALSGFDVPMQYSYDLGDQWLRKTGFPVVFAVFAVKDEAIRKNIARVTDVVESYKKSINEFNLNKKEVIRQASRKYEGIEYDLSGYYNLLKFEFTEDLKKALVYFFSEGESIGLLEKTDNIKFVDV